MTYTLGELLKAHLALLCVLSPLACSRASLPVFETSADAASTTDAASSDDAAPTDSAADTNDAAPAQDASTPPWEIDAGDDPDATCAGRVLDSGACLTTLVTGQDMPAGIAIDARNVYWVNYGSNFDNGSVMKLARSGGAPVTLASGLREPQDIAVDDTNVYWAGFGVSAVPLNGGAQRSIVNDFNSTCSFVTRSGSKLYWADSDFSFGVQSAMPDGSGVAWLTSNVTMIGGLAASRTGIVYTVATDQTNIPGEIVSVTFGGVATTLLMTPGSLGLVRSAYDTIVYIDESRAMYSLPLHGGTPTFLANNLYAHDMITDGKSVYWTDGSIRGVMKLDIAGGAPVVLVSTADDSSIYGMGSLTIDAHSVFFTEPLRGGKVFKLTPR